MGAYKSKTIYQFLVVSENIAKTIKQKIKKLKDKIIDANDNNMAMVENGNIGSTFCKS